MKLRRRIAAGAIAGAVGTALMDVELFRRYRRDGGKETFRHWEFAGGVMSWDQASAPGQLGMKLERLVLHRPPPDEWARPTTNLMHWAAGIGWGVQYGLLGRTAARHPLAGGLALGPTAWLASYVILPLAKVYRPIWEYDAQTLAKDLSAHLVFGSGTAAAFSVLSRERS